MARRTNGDGHRTGALRKGRLALRGEHEHAVHTAFYRLVRPLPVVSASLQASSLRLKMLCLDVLRSNNVATKVNEVNNEKYQNRGYPTGGIFARPETLCLL